MSTTNTPTRTRTRTRGAAVRIPAQQAAWRRGERSPRGDRPDVELVGEPCELPRCDTRIITRVVL